MIGRLRGKFISGKNGVAIFEVGGVGYEVHLGSSDLARLASFQEGEQAVYTDTVMREDSLKLFGFLSEGARDLFRILCSVSGVGPKTGLAIIDQLGAEEVVRAARTGNHIAFRSVSGIGDKIARKITLEMESQLKKLEDWVVQPSAQHEETQAAASMASDLVSAMVNLGYQKSRVEKVVKSIWQDNADFETLFKLAAGKLAERGSQ